MVMESPGHPARPLPPTGAPARSVTSADAVYAFTTAWFAALADSGVRHVVVSPGSRSTPLTLAAARTSALRCWPVVDERSAGFFALGMARQSRAPVALVCTSGSAAANYLPAVVEAHHARVPLVLLTADRPPELRGWGAGQTIEQQALYGAHARWLGELPVAGERGASPEVARAWAVRCVAQARRSPAGPVHLNFPFREPLEPRASLSRAATEATARAAATHSVPAPAADPDQVAELAERVREHPRGLIAVGPLDATPDLAEAVAALARASGWPILADPLSGLRRGPHVEGTPLLAAADLWGRDEGLTSGVAPDVVLRLGAMPTSKAFRLWMERVRPRHLVRVDPDDSWADPSFASTWILDADPAALCRAVARRAATLPPDSRRTEWTRGLVALDRRAAGAAARSLEGGGLDEPAAIRAALEVLPDGATLWVGNSMPVRDLDAALRPGPGPLRVLASRGANGIDGNVSSALGAAAASGAPTLLVCGDLTFLHDLGGLLSATRFALPAVVLVLDNDGGGIFSMLPVAARSDPGDFERYFRTPHGLDLARAGDLFGLEVERVADADDLRRAVAEGLACGRPRLVVARVDRDAGFATRRAAVAAATEAARGEDGA